MFYRDIEYLATRPLCVVLLLRLALPRPAAPPMQTKRSRRLQHVHADVHQRPLWKLRVEQPTPLKRRLRVAAKAEASMRRHQPTTPQVAAPGRGMQQSARQVTILKAKGKSHLVV